LFWLKNAIWSYVPLFDIANETNVAQLNSRLQNQQDQLDLLKKQLDSHNPLRDQLVQIQVKNLDSE
jgi:hypothetical protein